MESTIKETYLDVVASVEHFEVKMQRGLGRPEPEYITWGCNLREIQKNCFRISESAVIQHTSLASR